MCCGLFEDVFDCYYCFVGERDSCNRLCPVSRICTGNYMSFSLFEGMRIFYVMDL